ncbi:MAG TPA: transglycosylase SLT domain-containing protein [Burkholderiales bacterium]|nr:transglycosylase SLT domain-containing protein [Burkholderiales bacterium]
MKRTRTRTAIAARLLLLLACMSVLRLSFAGEQQYEPLSASVQAVLHRSVADRASQRLTFASQTEGAAWLADMSRRLERHIPDDIARQDFLVTVQYEATRAGLDPQLVLGVIQVESKFRKYAVSKAGARGYMQVMPFWLKLIGDGNQNLFNLRTNLRYGCTILRHYLNIERGDTFRALARYNGSLGKSHYPENVLRAWTAQWGYERGRPSIIIAPTRYLGDN